MVAKANILQSNKVADIVINHVITREAIITCDFWEIFWKEYPYEHIG